jgi:hypothetical protein
MRALENARHDAPQRVIVLRQLFNLYQRIVESSCQRA